MGGKYNGQFDWIGTKSEFHLDRGDGGCHNCWRLFRVNCLDKRLAAARAVFYWGGAVPIASALQLVRWHGRGQEGRRIPCRRTIQRDS